MPDQAIFGQALKLLISKNLACGNRKNLMHLQELKDIIESFYQLFVSVQESRDIIVSFHQLMQFWAVKDKYGL